MMPGQTDKIGEAEHDAGTLKFIELHSRQVGFAREHKVAAVLSNINGSARLLFDGGGHVDVCGGAEHWWLLLEIAKLKNRPA